MSTQPDGCVACEMQPTGHTGQTEQVYGSEISLLLLLWHKRQADT